MYTRTFFHKNRMSRDQSLKIVKKWVFVGKIIYTQQSVFSKSTLGNSHH